MCDNDNKIDLLIEEGIKIYNGDGVKRKFAKAVHRFLKASKTDARGALWYGKCKFYGNGVVYDPKKAFVFFNQAAEGGLNEGKYYIALSYLDGLGVEINQEKGVNILTELKKEDYIPAIHQLGICFLTGKGVNRNIEKAKELFLNASKKGYVLSEIFYANLLNDCEKQKIRKQLDENVLKVIEKDIDVQFEYGKFLRKENEKESFNFITKAAKNHNRDAQCFLGKIYYGIEKYDSIATISYPLASKYFRKSANHGCCEAMVYYGLFKLYMSSYEPEDIPGGVCFIKDAANHHHPDGLYHYANLLYRGYGVEKDIDESLKYYNAAAKRGQMDALVRYCSFLIEGKVIEKDIYKACLYLKDGISKGCKAANIMYGDLLRKGIIKKHPDESISDYYKDGGVLISFNVNPIPDVESPKS